ASLETGRRLRQSRRRGGRVKSGRNVNGVFCRENKSDPTSKSDLESDDCRFLLESSPLWKIAKSALGYSEATFVGWCWRIEGGEAKVKWRKK
ncbi:hypothetical protein M406DRAFT_102470, partial [Cryphonectria parasitica EP155]